MDRVDSKASKELELHEYEGNSTDQSGRPVSRFAALGVRETLRLFKKNVFICVLVLMITMNDGYQISIPGQMIANTGFIRQFATETTADGAPALSANVVGAWSAIYSALYIVTLLLSPFVNDFAGRKVGMAIIGIACVIGTLVAMFATEWGVWSIGRAMHGVAVGFAQSTLTAYVSEIAPTPIRGALLGVYSIFFALGQFAAAICLYIVEQTTPLEYKRAIYSEWVFSGIFLFCWLYIPESPSWLIRKGKDDKAKRMLKRVNGGVPGYDLEYEFNVYRADVHAGLEEASRQGKVDWRSIYRRPVNLRRTFISFWPLALQQLIGIPVVFGYTSVFFAEAGLPNPFLGVVIVQLILLVFIAVSFSVVDRVGRRPLYMVNGTIMIVSLLVIGICGTINVSSQALTIVTIVFLCFWVAAYALSAGPLGYVYLAESSTPALRAKTTGHAAAGTGVFGLIFNYCSPLMLLSEGGGAGWGIKTAYFYAIAGAIALTIFYFTVPETKGRTYAALDELFERRISARKFRQTTTRVEDEAGLTNRIVKV